MTKYATQRNYQPYIDAVMDDLGLTGKVDITWKFKAYSSMGGDAVLHGNKDSDFMPYGIIRIDHKATHDYIVKAIMHELKHIWQDYHGYYEPFLHTYTTRRGTIGYKWMAKWHGQDYESFNHASADFHPDHKKYWNSPWEVEAREYEKEQDRLFPNGKPQAKKLIGSVGGATFYKIAS